jgi:putative Mn2+ efflux pump MntP
MAAIILSLGLDHLLISAAIGASGSNRRPRLAFVFALFQALMPAIGFLAGTLLALWIGGWAFYVGILGLVGLGVYIIFEKDNNKDNIISEALKGRAFVAVAAFSVAVDELAVGFAIGMLDFPLWPALFVMAAQAFVFACLGLAFGSKIRSFFGGAAEKSTGAALLVVAVMLSIERWFSI